MRVFLEDGKVLKAWRGMGSTNQIKLARRVLTTQLSPSSRSSTSRAFLENRLMMGVRLFLMPYYVERKVGKGAQNTGEVNQIFNFKPRIDDVLKDVIN